MYARVSSFQIKPDKIAEMRAAMPAAGAKLKAIPGITECKTCWDESGKGIVFALYQSQQHAEASADTVRSIWGGLMGYLAAPLALSTGTEVIDLLA
jgi:hypothetical protein